MSSIERIQALFIDTQTWRFAAIKYTDKKKTETKAATECDFIIPASTLKETSNSQKKKKKVQGEIIPQTGKVDNSKLTHSHTMTPFDAPGKQAF